MDWASQCAAVIPCLDEAPTIGSLVRQVRIYLPTVLVVDDGSRDGTAVAADAAGATVLANACNQGKGAALARAFGRARELGFRWALTLDGDGQHSPGDIPAFLVAARSTGARLVVGNRMNAPGGMPWLRRTANRWMSHRLSELAGQTLPDSQCGLRLIDLGAWATLNLTTRHFEVESESLLAFARAGLPIAFVGIAVQPTVRPSRIHPLRDTVRWLRWWLGARGTPVPDLHPPGAIPSVDPESPCPL